MKNGVIVLIDDSRTELMLMEDAYKGTNSHHALVMFTDATKAFDYIKLHIKDIFTVISDISMPGMDGIELLKQINNTPELKMQVIPFVYLTNSIIPSDVERAYELSAQGYFQKPILHDKMVGVFQSIINYWQQSRIPRESKN